MNNPSNDTEVDSTNSKDEPSIIAHTTSTESQEVHDEHIAVEHTITNQSVQTISTEMVWFQQSAEPIVAKLVH